MNKQLKHDSDDIASLLEKVKLQGLAYLQTLGSRPTSTNLSVNLNDNLAENGIGTLAALEEFNHRFEPIIVSSSGPRFWGFVTGGTTPASIVGDWLTSIYDQNTQEIKAQGDISANIEVETIQLLLDLFELPRDYFGGLVTGATMSNFTCLGVARQWLGKESGKDFAKDGVSGNPKILTATAHSSAIKSLSMLGIGSKNIIKVKTIEGNREAIDIPDLEHNLKILNGEPSILIASGGTVNTVDFDDFESISKLKETYNFWLHIDAAFGGFAACSNQTKHLLNGWEIADSITIDCHKWLNVPYESAVFFVKEKHNILQIETFQNSNAPYLGDPMDHFDYLNFLPENSRRLKALPVWFSLIAYGKKGINEIVENNIKVARLFGNLIEESVGFELLAPVRLNTVCFTLSGENRQENVKPFLRKLNDTGEVFMTPTVYSGKIGIRAAFVNWRTTEKDVEIVFDLMKSLVSSDAAADL
jgi:glutamate/tyrosine decarboxylase-like PLP-dependent enzyme